MAIEVSISDALKGSVTLSDLLHAEGSFICPMGAGVIAGQDRHLFRIAAENFFFSFSAGDGSMTLTRGDSALTVQPNLDASRLHEMVYITITWSLSEITIYLGIPPSPLQRFSKLIAAQPVPRSLLRHARSQKLLPSTTFTSLEELRNTTYEALVNLQSDVERIGSYNAFWDVVRDSKRIVTRSPKLETDIHPTIELLCTDVSILRSIEVVREGTTGVGNLDFAFVGSVADEGLHSICIEVKRAHATDIIHGLEHQLPAYMRSKSEPYGAYVVLWFKCEWFDQPRGTQEELILELEKVRLRKSPELDNIRIFVIDVGKPAVASARNTGLP